MTRPRLKLVDEMWMGKKRKKTKKKKRLSKCPDLEGQAYVLSGRLQIDWSYIYIYISTCRLKILWRGGENEVCEEIEFELENTSFDVCECVFVWLPSLVCCVLSTERRKKNIYKYIHKYI